MGLAHSYLPIMDGKLWRRRGISTNLAPNGVSAFFDLRVFLGYNLRILFIFLSELDILLRAN